MSAFLLAVTMASAPADAQRPTVERPPVLRRVSPTLDPSKAKLARSIAARLLPEGTMSDLFREPFNMKVLGLGHSFLMLPVERLAQEQGVTLPEEGRDGPPVLRLRLLDILDPSNQRRISVIEPLLHELTAEAAAREEPRLREALALAYGQRLSVSELEALDRFLATPEGKAFARVSAMLENDFDLFAARRAIDRSIEEALPTMMVRLSAATASLPSVRTVCDLSALERKEVANLLDVDPATLSRPKAPDVDRPE